MNGKAKSLRTLPVLGAGCAPAVAAPPAEAGAVGAGVRVAVVTLGCDKNTVDSERLLAGLVGAGGVVERDPARADLVVVNTCGFIDVAKEESVATILELARLKRTGTVRAVVATGCLVQRYKDELAEEIPEVDLFLGTAEVHRLVPELSARGLLPARGADTPLMERPLRALATEAVHSAHLKISEGCDHGCAFCAIPLMRGRHRSVPIERLVREARELEARGVVELNLVSQDTTWYGRDWRRGIPADDGAWFVGRPFDGMAGPHAEPAATVARAGGPAGANGTTPGHGALPELLRALLRETSIPWLRLFYMYPSGISRPLVELIAAEPRIVPYLDMPIQHGSDRILERMRRPERQATIRERVRWLRDGIPDLALRTTVIVGFPGETDEDFEELLALLEELRFDHVGAFAFSPEEGTPAASMPEQIDQALKRERLERLLELQRGISLERNEARVGREVSVLVDLAGSGEDGCAGTGRTQAQAPEVDGVVHLRGGRRLRPGEFVRARLEEADEYDLFARVLDDRGQGWP